jgi:hypothetical protein
LAICLVGGALTGFIVKFVQGPKVYFNDYDHFHDVVKPDGYDAVT